MSLNKHCGKLPINVFYPPTGSDFQLWIRSYPQVTLHAASPPGAQGWNVKPQALLYLMDRGFDEIVWIDSDVIITRDFTQTLGLLDPCVIAIAEEALWGWRDDSDALRARLWGFDVGRALPFTLNTGVLRVTRLHYKVLQQWREILESNEYRNVQQATWDNRPVHMKGDQDVLTAILSSAQCAHVPLRILARGKDIVQYFGLYGYTAYERAYNILCDSTMFIHSQGIKPWLEPWATSRRRSFRQYIESVYLDLSPYTLAAKSYRAELDCECSWMTPHFKFSAIMWVGGFSYIPLVGLPIALISDFIRIAKHFFRRVSRR
jgi:hypothetical protein